MREEVKDVGLEGGRMDGIDGDLDVGTTNSIGIQK